MPNPNLLPVAASEDDAVVLGSAIKMLQQQLTEEKQKNKSLKEQLDKENVATPVSFAPFSVDQSLRLGESFGTLFGMTEVGPSTNVAEDKPLVEESQTPPPPISSPFAIPSIRMSFFGATTEPPSSTLNADNEGSSTEYVPPVPTTFYSNMMPSIPFYGASKETEITTESSTVAAPMLQSQGPAIDVQVPPMSPIPAQSEVVPPSPISSPFSIPMNPMSYFGMTTEQSLQSSAEIICPPVGVRDLGTTFDTEVVHQSPAGKASSGSPAKTPNTPNMDPIRVAVEAVLEIHAQEDRARITELENLLSAANESKEETNRMLNSVREDMQACERQIAAARETDADRLQRIAELEGRTRNYLSRITELESLASTDREQLVDLQMRLEELVTEKRKRDETTGVNPLIQKQRDVDRKEISRLSKLLDETMTALNETHKACEVAEAQVRELQATAKRNDSSTADSGCTTRESAATSTATDDAAVIKVNELQQQLELLRSSQTSADLCLIQMDEQRKKANDEAALLRAQLSESQSKLALMVLQHQQLVDATVDKPPYTTTPSALRSRSSSSSISGVNTPPRPPVSTSGTAYSQPPTPATPGPDDAKRMERVRIINAGLLRLAQDAEFQEDIKVFTHLHRTTSSSSF